MFEALQNRAEEGDPESQFLVASMYAAGTVVEQDNREATQWFQRSAEQGYAESFLPLAQAHLNGLGIPQNVVTAHLWFNLAAGRLSGTDRTFATEQRDLVQAQMSQSQPDTPLTIELNIPKPPGVRRADSTG